MVTDPLGGASWNNGSSSEVADLCQSSPGASQVVQLGSHQYGVQTLCSNESSNCESSRALAPLTIAANAANSPSMTYGGVMPAITPGYSGLVNGDTAPATAPNCTITASSSPVGAYPTSCSGAVDVRYAVQYQAGTLTVNAAPLTITAGSPSVSYGDSVPSISPGYSGFVNGDSAASLSTPPSCATTYTAGSQNYLPVPSVAQSFTVSGSPLTLALSLNSSPAGPVNTGSTVTASLMLGNHTAAAQTVTLAYKGTRGSLNLTLPLTLKLSAGQTLGKSVSFRIQFWFPRGADTVSAVATDKSGDTASSAASLTVS